MASLVLTTTAQNTAVNLTTLAYDNWVAWASSDTGGTATEHKSGGVGTIGAVAVYGSGSLSGFQFGPTFSFTDGTPTASGSMSGDVVYNSSTTTGDGVTVAFVADTTTRTARLYIEYFDSDVTVTAILSDGSVGNQTDSSLPNSGNFVNAYGFVDVSYAAGSAGQTMTIRVVSKGGSLGGNAQMGVMAALVKVTAASSTGAFSGSGSATPTGTGASKVAAAISETATTTATGAGASVVAAAGSVTAIASAIGVGASRVAGVVSETSAAVVLGVGQSTASGVVSETAVATAAAVGVSTASGAISETSTATVLGVSNNGGTLTAGAGSSTSVATVQAVGAATAASDISESAVANASGTGASTVAGVISEVAVGNAQGTGATVGGIVAAAGSISASGAANGTGGIIVSAAGRIAISANAYGTPTKTSHRVDGGARRRQIDREREEAELMHLASMLVPLIAKGGPLCRH